MAKTNLGRNIRMIREFWEISQTEFAQKMGVSIHTQNKIEMCERDPTAAYLVRMLQIIPLTPNRLFKDAAIVDDNGRPPNAKKEAA